MSGAAPPAAPRGGTRAVRLPRALRRRQLLDAALQVFVERGYHATAMDEIAERAGVSKPVLYQHFPGKLELYLALLADSCARLAEQVAQALELATDNAGRVHACVAAYYDYVADERGAFRLVFESDLRGEPAVRELVDGALATAVQAIADTIAHDTGLERAEAELLSCGLAGLAEVSARWWVSGPAPLDRDRAVALMAGLAWRGLSGLPRTPVG